MKIPLVDLRAQYEAIRPEILEAVERVLDSQQFILGAEVATFEKAVAAACGTRFAVGVSSGTDALLVALMAAGVRAGDRVVTSAYSFIATADVIVRLGARPVFVDIEPTGFALDLDAAAERAVAVGARAVVPVHLFGQCLDLGPTVAALRERGLAVIEDAAQAFGAADGRGRLAGTTGLAGCFSFFPSKNLGACGDGGLLVTDDEAMAAMATALRSHGAFGPGQHRVIGGNFRLDAIQAAILQVKLKHVATWNIARRAVARRYRELIDAAGLAGVVRVPDDTPGHVYHQFVVRVPDRDRLRQFLADRGVSTAVYYPRPLPALECFRDLGYRPGDFPRAEEVAREALALPMYPELTEVQQLHVVDSIREFYR